LRAYFKIFLMMRKLSLAPNMSREGTNTIDGWDSIRHVELLYAIEEEFNITFSLKELQDIKTAQDMLDTIARHVDNDK
jgi:acyl carrier protein